MRTTLLFFALFLIGPFVYGQNGYHVELDPQEDIIVLDYDRYLNDYILILSRQNNHFIVTTLDKNGIVWVNHKITLEDNITLDDDESKQEYYDLNREGNGFLSIQFPFQENKSGFIQLKNWVPEKTAIIDTSSLTVLSDRGGSYAASYSLPQIENIENNDTFVIRRYLNTVNTTDVMSKKEKFSLGLSDDSEITKFESLNTFDLGHGISFSVTSINLSNKESVKSFIYKQLYIGDSQHTKLEFPNIKIKALQNDEFDNLYGVSDSLIFKWNSEFELLWCKKPNISFEDITNECLVVGEQEILIRLDTGTQEDFKGFSVLSFSTNGELNYAKHMIYEGATQIEKLLELNEGIIGNFTSRAGKQTIKKFNSNKELEDFLNIDLCLEVVDSHLEIIEHVSTDHIIERNPEDEPTFEIDVEEIDLQTTPFIIEPFLPIYEFEINEVEFCLGDTLTMNNSANFPIDRSFWMVTNLEENIIEFFEGIDLSYILENEGTYKIVNDFYFGNCLYKDSILFKVINQELNLLEDNYELCVNDELVIDLTNSGISDLLWHDEDNNLNKSFTEDEEIEINYTIDSICWLTEKARIELLQLPIIKPLQDTTICDDETLFLEVQVENTEDIEWSTGEITLGIEIEQSGDYFVEASNICGTIAEGLAIDIKDCSERIYIPNIFNPDSENGNETFQVHGFNVELSEMILFDRWGNQIHLDNEPPLTWNGIFKGRELEQGVFCYQLNYSYEGIHKSKKGTITLVR